jgi:hypothetical protein
MDQSALRLGMAMSLVARALGEDERKANSELSLVEAALRDSDLSCEALGGFIRALRLCSTAAPQHFHAVVLNAIRLHKQTLSRDAAFGWLEFLEYEITIWSQPLRFDFDEGCNLLRLLVGFAESQQSGDQERGNASRIRRLALLDVWAEARAQHRAAKLTVSALEVLRRRSNCSCASRPADLYHADAVSSSTRWRAVP